MILTTFGFTDNISPGKCLNLRYFNRVLKIRFLNLKSDISRKSSKKGKLDSGTFPIVACHQYNYLQLLYREVKGILLYQGFPRPILPTKHPERKEGCFVGEIGRGNPLVKKNFNLSSFEKQMSEFVSLQSGWLFY